MTSVKLKSILFLWLLLPLQVLSNQPENSFDDLLNEAGLTLVLPANFSQQAIQQNELFPYEHALRHENNTLEIRYAIRPLSRMEINYQDPHSSAPEPNHIFSMMFTALIGRLSNGGSSPHREYQLEEAQQKFNADWAAISVFDIEEEYSSDYKQAFLVALHKNNLSDAYLVILFNDYEQSKPLLDQAIQSLQFK